MSLTWFWHWLQLEILKIRYFLPHIFPPSLLLLLPSQKDVLREPVIEIQLMLGVCIPLPWSFSVVIPDLQVREQRARPSSAPFFPTCPEGLVQHLSLFGCEISTQFVRYVLCWPFLCELMSSSAPAAVSAVLIKPADENVYSWSLLWFRRKIWSWNQTFLQFCFCFFFVRKGQNCLNNEWQLTVTPACF